MNRSPFRLAALLFACLLGPAGLRPAAADPTQDGLYAGFITSQGTFWCRLEFEKTPRTVGNFISLAEGTREWVDFPTAKVRKARFYDGLTFHRVIDKFMIQSGSPNGRGNDGPGYQFADEFGAGLAHARDGTLSMANSGTNSNGAQFFVTVTNTPWLDGKHSVFGQVVEGLDVVHKISKVAVGLNDRPLVPVVIQELRILRIGAAAEAFDPAAVSPPPPDVGVVPIAVQRSGNTLDLLLQPRAKHLLHVFASDDLVAWGFGSTKETITNLNVEAFLQAPFTNFPAVYFRALEGGFEP